MPAINWNAVDRQIAAKRQQVQRGLLPRRAKATSGAPDDFQIGISRQMKPGASAAKPGRGTYPLA